ncbi:hypothetical protein EIN_528650 [Entamoeba invadens IP1]|uniref:Uncharacterized protein n=1 Tax=Entamoeba invadens IP1 TaxID=370355 RepID=A0A0A1TZ26_ENTIV|nr:hypothetical protein EIN_528650 [Entamoeba invadens IP1]ELP86786.1 hypothetical protein EIN_528650 [Entamoeba invadens IP1]|eukprot:XP_004253557.1 hypothetical protein EIN_528650 [Entamoeba invadens IP1]
MKLEPFYLANVVLYINDKMLFKTLRTVSKSITIAIDMLRTNPIYITRNPKYVCSVFPKINTFRSTPSFSYDLLKAFRTKISFLDFSQEIFSVDNKVFLDEEFCNKVVSLRIFQTDLTKIGRFKKLKKLYVENCANFDDFKMLENIEDLRVITFYMKNSKLKKQKSAIYKKFSKSEIFKNQGKFRRTKIWFVIDEKADNPQEDLMENVAFYYYENYKIIKESHANFLLQKPEIKYTFNSQKEDDEIYIENFENVEVDIISAGDVKLQNIQTNKLKVTNINSEISLVIPKVDEISVISGNERTVVVNPKELFSAFNVMLSGNVSLLESQFCFNKNLRQLKVISVRFFDFSVFLCPNLETADIEADFERLDFSKCNKLLFLKTKNYDRRGSILVPNGVEHFEAVGTGNGISIFGAGVDTKVTGNVIEFCIPQIEFETLFLDLSTDFQTTKITFSEFLETKVIKKKVPILRTNNVKINGCFNIDTLALLCGTKHVEICNNKLLKLDIYITDTEGMVFKEFVKGQIEYLINTKTDSRKRKKDYDNEIRKRLKYLDISDHSKKCVSGWENIVQNPSIHFYIEENVGDGQKKWSKMEK